MSESPLISIKVSSLIADEINVYHEDDCGWKIDGRKDGQSVHELDQLQDDFACVVRLLADYVDETSIWMLCPEMRLVSPFQALSLLAERDEGQRTTLLGRC